MTITDRPPKRRPQPVLCLHTTEGTTIAGAKTTMDANRSWSHWICDPLTGELENLVDTDGPARSLRNLAGGVETNNRPGVYQIEIVGKANDVPGYPHKWYTQLATWIIDLCDEHGIPRRFPHSFHGENAYGRNGVARLTNQQWLTVSGIIGHQHVPENTHWDPGDISRLIPLVTDGGQTVAHSNPYEAETNAALEILAASGHYRGDIDGWFGPMALAALRERDTEAGSWVAVEPMVQQLVDWRHAND